jgi:hypothetical protein
MASVLFEQQADDLLVFVRRARELVAMMPVRDEEFWTAANRIGGNGIAEIAKEGTALATVFRASSVGEAFFNGTPKE